MKRDKEWLKEEVIKISENWTEDIRGDFAKGLDRAVGHTVKLINQLDEPEVLSQEWIDEHKEFNGIRDDYVWVDDLKELLVPKQELPVIPKFVAKWYESEGKYIGWWNWFYKWGRDESRTELEAKTIKWMQDYNEEGFVDMFRYGYEVEREQKYYVLNNEKYFLLGKDKGHGFIFSTGGNSKLGSTERTSATFELTEQEIKDYDPRYLAFKVPVEDVEG